MMVVGVSGAGAGSQNPKTITPQDGMSRRPPLLPSEKDNGNGVANNQKKPKSRVVSSRYMSPSSSTSTSNSSSVSSSSSSSRRCPSPLISRTSTTLSSAASQPAKRSVSVDRRRPGASRPLNPYIDYTSSGTPEVSAAAKLLVTSSRSLSVSFQGEAFSLPISKTKVSPATQNFSNARKGTPERRRTSTPSRGEHVENFKLADHHRWPARDRLVNPLSKSINNDGNERVKVNGSGDAIRELKRSMIDEKSPSFDGRLSLDFDSSELLREPPPRPDRSVPCDYTASDSDSVSSASTSGIHETGGTSNALNGPRGIAVSAKFWQETNSRMRRLKDPGSPLSSSPGLRIAAPSKMKRFSIDGTVSSPRAMLSPGRGVNRPASPSKVPVGVGSCPPRSYSPARIRNAVSTICNNPVETTSVLSFAVDVRRGKVGENRIVDAHMLRLMYNRHLQWRIINATTESVLLVQKHSAQKNLWNAWITVSDLRDLVTKKRHKLQLVKQKLKLSLILKHEISLLEDWETMEKDQLFSLFGAIEALKASTFRLPLIGGASADVQSLKNAISTSIDVMKATASSIRFLLPMVEEVNSLVTKLAKLTIQERASLEQCTDLLSLLAGLQVQDGSLRTHILQCNGSASRMEGSQQSCRTLPWFSLYNLLGTNSIHNLSTSRKLHINKQKN